MYADRYGPKPVDRGSLSLSLGIVGGLLAAVMLSPTVIEHVRPDKPLETYTVPPTVTPPVDPPVTPRQETKRAPTVDQTTPVTITQPTETDYAKPDPGPPVTIDPGEGTGGGVVIDPPKPPPPVLRGSEIDGRYANQFQPEYPSEERRAGNTGVVMLKVLIGVDGRVRQVERLAAPSDAFWRVTEQRALSKWRFKPATRDGISYESWKTMTVRFRLEE